MHRNIEALHYLTQDLAFRTHEQQTRVACEAGVKWIQLRVKGKSKNECLDTAAAVKKITDEYGVTLVINDHPFIAKEIDAGGVHLGQQDMDYEEARRILGSEKIIGLSAHNEIELSKALMTGADYIGIGPFRFTSTKKDLDAILGIEGMKKLIKYADSIPHRKPLIAIGGITLDDIHSLLDAGIDGIAISSAINLHQNPKEAIQHFLKQLETFGRQRLSADDARNLKLETTNDAGFNNIR